MKERVGGGGGERVGGGRRGESGRGEEGRGESSPPPDLAASVDSSLTMSITAHRDSLEICEDMSGRIAGSESFVRLKEQTSSSETPKFLRTCLALLSFNFLRSPSVPTTGL